MAETAIEPRTHSRCSPDGASADETLAGPLLSWVVAVGKPNATNAPASLQPKVSWLVMPTVPPTVRTPTFFGQNVRTARRAVRHYQPDRKRIRAGRWLMVRTFAAAQSVAVFSFLLLGMSYWPIGMVCEPLLPCDALERRWPALWALWPPCRAAWRCSRIACPFLSPGFSCCHVTLSFVAFSVNTNFTLLSNLCLLRPGPYLKSESAPQLRLTLG